MITVTVKVIHGPERQFSFNTFSINLEKECSLRELLKKLDLEVREKAGRLESNMVIMVNGRNIHFLNGLETILKNGDVVVIMPILIGG
jgi:molybdopterin converting factor small subunit